jgi:hypothetical protein
MTKIAVLAYALFGLASSTAFAQSNGSARAPIGRVMDLWVTKTEQLVVPAADALPEGSYAFAPTVGEFTGVRTFAEQVKHLAAANYQLAARALGEQPPAGTQNETAPASVQTKAQIMAYLKGSFEWLHRAAVRVNTQNIEEPIMVGKETQNGVGLIIDALAHSQNHYGQMVEYLRMNHVVPPETRASALR